MLASLLRFYDRYPDILFYLKRIQRSSIDPDLQEELDFHGARQKEILDLAQVYQIDDHAEMMLRNLAGQMQRDGLDSMFSTIRMPFPAMLLTLPEPTTGSSPAALITQEDDTLFTQIFLVNKEGILPNLLIFKSRGASVDVLYSPTIRLARAIGEEISDDAALEQEKNLCFDFLAIAVGMSVLFEHKAMLERDEVPAYPRAERRRAIKSGQVLPNKSIIKVRLGDLGKRQLQAISEEESVSEEEKISRRAHWVQGHFMRNRSGGISWRSPHIRGAGPVIDQMRHISFEDD